MSPRRRRPRWQLLVAGSVLAAVAVAVVGYVAFGRSGEAPAPPALAATPTPSAGEPTRPGAADSPDGQWTVRPGGDSYVGYRVSERLAFLDSPSEAVGRTSAVTGELQVEGGRVVAGHVQADLQQLTSDQDRRDNAMQRRGLETGQFATATFTLDGPVTLNTDPARNQPVSAQVNGRLTIHGVTREVSVSLDGRWTGQTIEVAGQLPIRISDYGITLPEGGPVLSVQDEALVELQLTFIRS